MEKMVRDILKEALEESRVSWESPQVYRLSSFLELDGIRLKLSNPLTVRSRGCACHACTLR